MTMMDQVLHTFIAESQELLDLMETQLLTLENTPDDMETVNALFRAAHTIKGSSGMFGFEPIVKFTHTVETLLDLVRSGQLSLSAELTAELLTARDYIAELIDHLVVKQLAMDAEKQVYGDMLIERLSALKEPSVACQSAVEVVVGTVAENDLWHISLRCNPGLMQGGNDPLGLIRCLQTIGDVVQVRTLTDRLPTLNEINPEQLYFGFEISLRSAAEKAQIEEIFEWVSDECKLTILPPNSRIDDYVAMIYSLSEDPYMLGEILVSSGVITRKELDKVLSEQVHAQIQSDVAVKPLGELLVEEQLVAPKVVEAALERQKQVREVRQQENRFIRVSADKLDVLINLVGELVISSASAQLQAKISNLSHLVEVNATISRLVEEVRDSALKLRMVEIGETFHRFNRVVRDVSRELNKDIRLEVLGADTELDKTLVEKISDPLVHLVRNAMDHGIESQAQRESAGKSVQGCIRLNAYHESGSVVITVSDDGGGMRKDKILEKAIAKGLVLPHQNLSDNDVFALVFAPGFSTADAVTNLSGRGVGMDVVKRNIEALRGTVDIASTEGKGSTISIRLPLTLAIIDGFLVKVGQDAFVVPLDMVVECVELNDVLSDREADKQYINLRGEVLPYIRLRDHFSLGGHAGKRENIIVIHSHGQKAGLVVDSLLGEHQTVIKPLGKLFQHLRGIGGSTILGSGEVALILDVPSLIQAVEQQEINQTHKVSGNQRIVAIDS